MIRNYLKTAWRFLWKNKTFSFINMVGLTAGTLACLYIVLFVNDHYSYDKHHRDADDIYRVTSLLKLPGDETNQLATCSPPVAPALKSDFSDVVQYTRIVNTIGISHHLLRYRDKSFYETNAIFADSTFFDVFTYHFVYGSAAASIQEPYSVVLLQETAEKLFGKRNPIGETFEIDNSYGKHDFKVTGVVNEQLGKSHIKANMFIAMNSGGIGDFVRSNNSWAGNNFTSSYVKLLPSTSRMAMESKLPAFLKKYGAQQLHDLGMGKEIHLQPVTSIHTETGYNAEGNKTISPSFLNVLLLIAFLVQLIACINFMNLSTARSAKRAKEVGVRKVMGAGRGNLVQQFIGESSLVSVIAIVCAIPLLWLALPYLNEITQSNLQMSFSGNYTLWAMLVGITVVTALLAGSYPAFYLSAFNVVNVMKGNFSNKISSAGIRKSLVIFQFMLSIILIIGIITINRQMDFINRKDLGFEKDQRLIITFRTEEARKQMEAFRNDLLQMSEISAVSISNNYPSQFVYNDIPVYLKGGSMKTAKDAQFMRTDENFVKAGGLNIISGRDFHRNDSGKVLINETLARQLGIVPEKAQGTILYSQMGDTDDTPLQFEIAGVIRDFNYSSLHHAVDPFMLIYVGNTGELTHCIIATSSDNYQALLGKLKNAWQRFLPDLPFDYTFLDEEVQRQYMAEIRLSRIISAFALIAIIISCLGLFGLAAFTAEQRIKEIGIRKVLGASSGRLATLLSRDFMKLVAIAAVLAIPIGWWAMHKWLESFEYRVDVAWWVFALAGAIAFLIALVTVSFQAIRAAIANPLKSLRTE